MIADEVRGEGVGVRGSGGRGAAGSGIKCSPGVVYGISTRFSHAPRRKKNREEGKKKRMRKWRILLFSFSS